MEKPTKVASAIALTFLLFIGGLVAIPFLAVAAAGDSPGCGAAGPVEVEDDGTPSLLGPSTLTVADLRTWWTSSGRGQPTRLQMDIGDLIAVYLSEGDAEGVRGDMAFAQAVAETGYFTNTDTSINNFAGIAHYDGAASGAGFADPIIGVRAHIQLLKKYAGGNDVSLANADVSPNAGASASTWGGLAGTWATSSTYWTLLSDVYGSMLEAAGQTTATPWDGTSAGCPAGDLALAGDYALPVERRWYDEHPEWFTKPHHDYPAADIPVPTGTPLYAVTNGVVVSTPTSGRCGIGVILNGDDGAQYTYCHGLPGSHAITTGDRVTVGQYLMDSASTGNSTGPHLHFAIKVDGTARCPQEFLVSIVSDAPRFPGDLPRGGCTS
ncbi:peptidoglycan DD-metalloendopeptidase family protein [Iamia sp. SCSIO 61187]|uniref:peptidoglycan DD-metalloendopeptidase family protein n=1 Tax=Iamia sp. SCSIO 61187 TaxID=2722752 RepID=UPI001C63B231|nr:peptidoglycan DD-metalloendopeptidase family protein [Iamia sp. SCSIO 61187]QYG91792.1 peptidoglycan DD-metalloendopeptidase family protein [Iamia sp. SCSIO 61187]